MDQKDFTPRHKRILDQARADGTAQIGALFARHVRDLAAEGLVTYSTSKRQLGDGREITIFHVSLVQS